LSVTPDTVEDMTIDVRLRRPAVALRYLGVLVAAAVMALSAGVWHGGPSLVRASGWPVAPGWAAGPVSVAVSTGDTERRESKPAVLRQALRDRARALVTAAAGPSSAVPTWWIVVVGLAGGACLWQPLARRTAAPGRRPARAARAAAARLSLRVAPGPFPESHSFLRVPGRSARRALESS
jgi:hypothetical protein